MKALWADFIYELENSKTMLKKDTKTKLDQLKGSIEQPLFGFNEIVDLYNKLFKFAETNKQLEIPQLFKLKFILFFLAFYTIGDIGKSDTSLNKSQELLIYDNEYLSKLLAASHLASGDAENLSNFKADFVRGMDIKTISRWNEEKCFYIKSSDVQKENGHCVLIEYHRGDIKGSFKLEKDYSGVQLNNLCSTIAEKLKDVLMQDLKCDFACKLMGCFGQHSVGAALIGWPSTKTAEVMTIFMKLREYRLKSSFSSYQDFVLTQADNGVSIEYNSKCQILCDNTVVFLLPFKLQWTLSKVASDVNKLRVSCFNYNLGMPKFSIDFLARYDPDKSKAISEYLQSSSNQRGFWSRNLSQTPSPKVSSRHAIEILKTTKDQDIAAYVLRSDVLLDSFSKNQTEELVALYRNGDYQVLKKAINEATSAIAGQVKNQSQIEENKGNAEKSGGLLI